MAEVITKPQMTPTDWSKMVGVVATTSGKYHGHVPDIMKARAKAAAAPVGEGELYRYVDADKWEMIKNDQDRGAKVEIIGQKL